MSQSATGRGVQRVRHTLSFRLLEVVGVRPLSPHMRRITLGGPQLAGFHSPAPDDHVKLFFFPAGVAPVAPTPGEAGAPPVWPAGMDKPPMRDYTPRRYDAARGELDIDFVLHEESGPAGDWAAQAKIGDQLLLAGPRGSGLVPHRPAGYLLIADEAGLPALGRWLEDLPAGTPVQAFIEVDSPAEEQPLYTAAQLNLHWVHRRGAPAGDPALLLGALRAANLPKADVFAWAGAESSVVRALRPYLIEELGVAEDSIKTAGYWKRGVADHHD
ncbi:MAG: siderophore-interacting protein [Steroidobacteraceae bacterium]